MVPDVGGILLSVYLSGQQTQTPVTMKPTKHTPGPWTVSPSSKASTLTRVFSVDEGRLVASANGPGLSEIGEAEANARLIAAAPELLEALKAAQQLLSNIWTPEVGKRNVWTSTHAAIDAAIAKATTI